MGECARDNLPTPHTRCSSKSSSRARRAVIVSSVHDYRSKRRGSIQSIAEALARRGLQVTFASIRFSALSILKRDSRCFLWRKANKREEQDGISCFLWGTPFHPFATHSIAGDKLTSLLHDAYADWPNKELDSLLGSADIVLVESGLGIALAPRIRRLNRDCLLIYRASDALDTIGAHPHLATLLERHADAFDQFCLLSPQMAPAFARMRERTFCVPQGLESSDYDKTSPSPYGAGDHAVSVGSMLFDRSTFDVAAEAFPDVVFHVIGCGQTWSHAPNIVVYPEMKFTETLPYLAHAKVGVAAYRMARHCRYLADSSMKLTQYSCLRLPAVCPHFAVGSHAHRFGYKPGDAGEIVSAFEAALADTFSEGGQNPKNWDELVLRMLEPRSFADTHIPEHLFEAHEASEATQNGGEEPSFADDRPGREYLQARG